MKNIRNYLLLFVLIISMFFLSGCSNDREFNMQNKISAEIDFVESEVENFLKNCELGEYSKNNQIDWEKIKEDNKIFIDSFSVIEDDLTTVNIDSKKIDDIKDIIENMKVCTTNSEYENLKIEYSKLYIAFESIDINDLKKLKCIIMDIYINSINQNQDTLSSLITDLEEQYKSIDKNGEKAIEINRIYDIVNSIRTLFDNRDYEGIKKYSLQMLSIL